MLVAWGVHAPSGLARLAGLGAAVLATLYSTQLMYGLPGVLLPAALLIARSRGGLCWLMPALLAMAGNLTNSWLREHLLAPFTLLVLASAVSSIALGAWLLRQNHRPVPAVGRWGYAFYPLHLLAIKGLQAFG
jgi:hypothetical protein